MRAKYANDLFLSNSKDRNLVGGQKIANINCITELGRVGWLAHFVGGCVCNTKVIHVARVQIHSL